MILILATFIILAGLALGEHFRQSR